MVLGTCILYFRYRFWLLTFTHLRRTLLPKTWSKDFCILWLVEDEDRDDKNTNSIPVALNPITIPNIFPGGLFHYPRIDDS